MLQEFKKVIMRGNVVDLAVSVIHRQGMAARAPA
jgi:large-conductance mechanosensitive channel